MKPTIQRKSGLGAEDGQPRRGPSAEEPQRVGSAGKDWGSQQRRVAEGEMVR